MRIICAITTCAFTLHAQAVNPYTGFFDTQEVGREIEGKTLYFNMPKTSIALKTLKVDFGRSNVACAEFTTTYQILHRSSFCSLRWGVVGNTFWIVDILGKYPLVTFRLKAQSNLSRSSRSSDQSINAYDVYLLQGKEWQFQKLRKESDLEFRPETQLSIMERMLADVAEGEAAMKVYLDLMTPKTESERVRLAEKTKKLIERAQALAEIDDESDQDFTPDTAIVKTVSNNTISWIDKVGNRTSYMFYQDGKACISIKNLLDCTYRWNNAGPNSVRILRWDPGSNSWVIFNEFAMKIKNSALVFYFLADKNNRSSLYSTNAVLYGGDVYSMAQRYEAVNNKIRSEQQARFRWPSAAELESAFKTGLGIAGVVLGVVLIAKSSSSSSSSAERVKPEDSYVWCDSLGGTILEGSGQQCPSK